MFVTFTMNLSERLRTDKELFSEEWHSYENKVYILYTM
jgi:hypothetical protein